MTSRNPVANRLCESRQQTYIRLSRLAILFHDSQSRKERLLHPNYFDSQRFSTPRHVRPKCRLGPRALDVTNQNKECEEALVPSFQTLDGHQSIVMVTHKKFRKEALHKPFSGPRGYGSGRRGVKDA